jgi:hypothetical protein
MIIKLRTSYLQPGELAETANAFLQKVNSFTPLDPFLERITNLLQEDLSTLNNALTAVRINALVKAVSEADALRDDLFIAFRDSLDILKRRPSETFQAAYLALWPILEQAGTLLYSLGYSEQSGRLEALIEQMNLPANQTHLTNTGLTGLFEEMKQAQANFTELYQKRLDLDSQQDYPTLAEAKSSIVPRINMLLDAVSILHEEDAETLGPLVRELNAITSQIMAIARARRTRDASALAGEPVIDEEVSAD